MHPAEGRGVELRLNDTLLHGWCRMLQKACREAEWDLVPDFPGGTQRAKAKSRPAYRIGCARHACHARTLMDIASQLCTACEAH